MKRKHNIKACRRLSQPTDLIVTGIIEKALDEICKTLVEKAASDFWKNVARFHRRAQLQIDVLARRN